MAVKAGGGTDPEKNRQLGQVIAEAKVNNVPKDVIARNIEKGNAAATVDFKSSSTELFSGRISIPCMICMMHTMRLRLENKSTASAV